MKGDVWKRPSDELRSERNKLTGGRCRSEEIVRKQR